MQGECRSPGRNGGPAFVQNRAAVSNERAKRRCVLATYSARLSAGTPWEVAISSAIIVIRALIPFIDQALAVVFAAFVFVGCALNSARSNRAGLMHSTGG